MASMRATIFDRVNGSVHPIPPITDPLGRFWVQPERAEIEIRGEEALMTESAFKKLAHYDSTLPSGTYDGKMWACQTRDGIEFLRWYGPAEDPKMIKVFSRRIVLTTTPAPPAH
jgi:hypothetical protein